MHAHEPRRIEARLDFGHRLAAQFPKPILRRNRITAQSLYWLGQRSRLCYSATVMANTPSTSFRFPHQLLRELDRYAARLSREAGVPVSRAAAAARLLAAALAAEKSAQPRGGRRA